MAETYFKSIHAPVTSTFRAGFKYFEHMRYIEMAQIEEKLEYVGFGVTSYNSHAENGWGGVSVW